MHVRKIHVLPLHVISQTLNSPVLGKADGVVTVMAVLCLPHFRSPEDKRLRPRYARNPEKRLGGECWTQDLISSIRHGIIVALLANLLVSYLVCFLFVCCSSIMFPQWSSYA